MNAPHRMPAAIAALVSSLLVSACATVISSPRQSVKIDSVPQGARVYTAVLAHGRQGGLVKRAEVGVTPMTVSITRKDGVVELEKEGYELTRVPMKRGLNPWFFGNVLMTSLVSSCIDSSTGAINEYDPDEYRVELQPLANVVPNATGAQAQPDVRPLEPQGQAPEEPLVPDVRPLSPAEKSK
jgi:hypothetical protein